MLMRITSFIALYLMSGYGLAMSFAGLTHEINFQPHSAQISAEEIRSFIDWQSEKKREFSGGEYDVFLIKNTAMQVTDALLKKRAETVVQLMNNLGIQTEVSVEERFNKVKYQELIDRLNSAVVVIQPPCTKTHDCGPQPISGSKPPGPNK
ncbi:hypothetical protein [Collimonas silvisoli]|uniref:hypothetical protein n=1 Tax=Collimonas silvisoli TaxID=2825884 RepID=UPI001B8C4D71|nr:hypothetical protein [Collimonas silvisoli]